MFFDSRTWRPPAAAHRGLAQLQDLGLSAEPTPDHDERVGVIHHHLGLPLPCRCPAANAVLIHSRGGGAAAPPGSSCALPPGPSATAAPTSAWCWYRHHARKSSVKPRASRTVTTTRSASDGEAGLAPVPAPAPAARLRRGRRCRLLDQGADAHAESSHERRRGAAGRVGAAQRRGGAARHRGGGRAVVRTGHLADVQSCRTKALSGAGPRAPRRGTPRLGRRPPRSECRRRTAPCALVTNARGPGAPARPGRAGRTRRRGPREVSVSEFS